MDEHSATGVPNLNPPLVSPSLETLPSSISPNCSNAMDSHEKQKPRLLVAAADPYNGFSLKGHVVLLRDPKTGDDKNYLLLYRTLQEFNWYKQSHGSWFMGDYICEDGSLYAATPVDPVFVLLPMFDRARMKDGDDPGVFRPLDEIIFYDYPAYLYLQTIAEDSMELVCDCKVIGSTKFFRLNDSKVLAWMYCKVQQLKQALPQVDKNYAARSQKDILADVVMIMGEYLPDEPWLKLLCDNLGLNMSDVVRKPATKTHMSEAPSIPSLPSPTQTGSDKRVTKQKKKAKVETRSHNIKDMFSRALKKEK